MLEDEELILEKIRSAVSDYSCDAEDRDFEILVRIKCNNGWTSAEIIKIEDNYETMDSER